jgi:multidrug resistance efflux pump
MDPNSPDDSSSSEGENEEALFREEALEHYLDESDEGDLLRASPAWANWTYRLLVIVTVSGLAYIVLGWAPVYETGPALLRVVDAAPINAPIDGTIESVDVLPGQQVSAGQELGRFRAERESALLERVQAEFELQLLARLRDPNDADAERELRRLRPELERARVDLQQTRILATRDGAVQDVRIRPGDFLQAGEPALTLTPAEPQYAVIALLPGHVLPQLERGMRVRLIIEGYAYAEIMTSIESIGSQVIGPSEARRFLGQGIGDAIDIPGPVVVVRCALAENSFVTGSREYRVHDGMNATAEVEVRRERLLFRLIPAFRGLGSRG